MGVRRELRTWVLLLGAVAGCGPPPLTAADTGARDVVRTYYDGLLRRDWSRSYAVLHPDSRKHGTEIHFTRRAEA